MNPLFIVAPTAVVLSLLFLFFFVVCFRGVCLVLILTALNFVSSFAYLALQGRASKSTLIAF